MGRYVTPRGVVVETSDAAALAVGYKPADEPAEAPKKAPAKKASSKKSED